MCLRPSRAKVDETRLVGVERKPEPSKTFVQHCQDTLGVDDVVERHERIVSVAGNGTVPAETRAHLSLEPFVQQCRKIFERQGETTPP